jgi:NAD(P)-dependent dehydrogenase (short-subunit alcohol dehydrogenase family)
MINKANPETNRDVVVISGTLADAVGAAIRRFARQGALIGILGHGREALEQARREAQAAGGDAIALPVDVANPGEIESALSVIERHFGPIDVWINYALAGAFTPPANDSSRRSAETAYLAVVHGTMAALKRMLPRNRGAIVQVAPSYGDPSLYSVDYGAKRLIQGFCESMRAELMRDARGVNLTMVEVPMRSGSHPFVGSADWLGASCLGAIGAQAAAEAIYAAAGLHAAAAPSGHDIPQGGFVAAGMRPSSGTGVQDYTDPRCIFHIAGVADSTHNR